MDGWLSVCRADQTRLRGPLLLLPLRLLLLRVRAVRGKPEESQGRKHRDVANRDVIRERAVVHRSRGPKRAPKRERKVG